MDSLDSIKFPLDIAMKEINRYREKISRYEKDDVQACKLYMEMAKTAIDGLVKEAQSILLQARTMDIDHTQEINNLDKRIDNYLYTDNLRPALNDAISGLKGISDAMEKHAERFFQWPWVKKNRLEAVENFRDLLQHLTDYLHSLQVDYLPGGSGMLVSDLYEIKHILNDIHQKPEKIKLAEYIDSSEKDRSAIYDNYLQMNGKITEIFEKIRTSIR